MTAAERHQRWINKPGNREKRRATSRAWHAANPDRVKELKKKPQTVANKKAYRLRPEVKVAERARETTRLRDPKKRVGRLIASAKNRATRFKLPFLITMADVQSLLDAGFCPYTGQTFDFSGPLKGLRKNPWSPSIDRIKPELGYVCGNVEVVSTWYNLAKNQWPPEVMQAAIIGLKRTTKFPAR